MITINSSGREQFRIPVYAPATPVATGPEFAFSSGSIDDDSLTWVAGDWRGSWDPSTGLAEALSPTVGSASADVELAGGSTYDVWIRYTYDTDKTPVHHAGTIYVR